jgi:hypothetical protein
MINLRPVSLCLLASIMHHVGPETDQQLVTLDLNQKQSKFISSSMSHAAVKAYKQVLVLLETQQVLLSQTDSPAACTQLDQVTKA